jgi:predicted PurR-regulated permease PerM
VDRIAAHMSAPDAEEASSNPGASPGDARGARGHAGEQSALRAVTLALVALSGLLALASLTSIVLAAWTAAVSRPLLARLERVLGGRRAATAVLVLALLAMIVVPVTLGVVVVASEARALAATMMQAPSARGALEALLANGATDGAPWPRDTASALALVERYGANAWAIGARIAGAASRGLVDVFVFVAGVVFMLLDGDEAWAWALDHSPLARRHLARFGQAFRETGSGLLLGVGLTTAAQALAATAIYAVLGVPRAWLFGPLTGLASVVPFVGSALVWAPLAIGFVVAGASSKAFALTVLGVLVIGTIDNVLRPVFSRFGALDMHVFLLVVSIFGGLATIGPAGAAFGPLVVRLTIEALRLAREERTGEG